MTGELLKLNRDLFVGDLCVYHIMKPVSLLPGALMLRELLYEQISIPFRYDGFDPGPGFHDPNFQ